MADETTRYFLRMKYKDLYFENFNEAANYVKDNKLEYKKFDIDQYINVIYLQDSEFNKDAGEGYCLGYECGLDGSVEDELTYMF